MLGNSSERGISFAYDLTGTGWAEAAVSDGKQSRRMTVSYLSDALGDMTRAVVRLLQGSQDERVSFLGEPGEHVWTLRSEDGKTLRVEVAWFEDWVEVDKSQEKREVFSTECRLLDFAQEVHAVLDRLMEKYGLEGYEQRWVEHEFPLTDSAKLKQEFARASASDERREE